MANDKRINFYLKKFLSVDQVETNWFQYLVNRLVDIFTRTYPQSGIWEPVPFNMAGGSVNDTFTLAGGADAILMNDAANLLSLAGAFGTDIKFENANAIDYYVGARHIEIPDEPETNPRYNTPQWKLFRDAVGELDDPDSVSDQGGGVFRFVVNSVTESGVDHSGRTCRVYLKTPVDLGDNYVEATISYSGGNNYVDISTGGALGTISTDETLYSAVVEGYTWKRNTDLSTLDEYAFVGVVTGNGPSAIPTVFDTGGQTILPRIYTDTDFLNLLDAFKLEHRYDPGTGKHGDIIVTEVRADPDVAPQDLYLKSKYNVVVFPDDENLFTNGAFIIYGNGSTALGNRMFEVREKPSEGGKVALLAVGWHGDTGRLNILPSDFVSGDPANPEYMGGGGGFVTCAGAADLFASVPIPRGFKATDIIVNASGTGNFNANRCSVSTGGVITTLRAGGSLNTPYTLSPELSSSEDDYLGVRIYGASKGNIYGVEITLAPINL